MFVIYINDIPTDIKASSIQDAIKWIESQGKCYPSGFSLTEWYDPDHIRFYNIVEVEQNS